MPNMKQANKYQIQAFKAMDAEFAAEYRRSTNPDALISIEQRASDALAKILSKVDGSSVLREVPHLVEYAQRNVVLQLETLVDQYNAANRIFAKVENAIVRNVAGFGAAQYLCKQAEKRGKLAGQVAQVRDTYRAFDGVLSMSNYDLLDAADEIVSEDAIRKRAEMPELPTIDAEQTAQSLRPSRDEHLKFDWKPVSV